MNTTGQPSTPSITHHENHWVSDGNIILSAISSKDSSTVLFRVHRSLLSDQSEVFASMFELPQGEGSCHIEYYDGLPLVRLPDMSEDVVALLDVLRDPLCVSLILFELDKISDCPLVYISSHFYERSLESDTPRRIRPALHMASKYLMTSLQAKLVGIFESEWPLSVDDLELKDQLLFDYMAHDPQGIREDPNDFCCDWPLHFVPEPASAIALAEEFDIPSILPAAYYDILRCAPRKDWDRTFRWGNAYLINTSDKPARWECLSGKSLRKIHYLQDVLWEETENRFDLLEGYQPKDCREEQSGRCRRAWVKLVKEIRQMPDRVQERDLLKQLRDLRVGIFRDAPCSKCKYAYLETIREHRKDMWSCFEQVCLGADYEDL